MIPINLVLSITFQEMFMTDLCPGLLNITSRTVDKMESHVSTCTAVITDGIVIDMSRVVINRSRGIDHGP